MARTGREKGEDASQRGGILRWSPEEEKHRSNRTSGKERAIDDAALLFPSFFAWERNSKAYLAERVTGDLLRQALVEEGAAILLVCVIEKREKEVAREREGEGEEPSAAASIAVFFAPRDQDFQVHQSTHSLLSSSISSFFWHPVEGYAMLSCCLEV